MATQRSSSSILRRIGLVIAALIVGVPVAMVFTHGMILIVPLLLVMVLGPLGIIHYLLWGWWLSPGKSKEDEQSKSAFEGMGISSTSNAEGIVSKAQKHGFFRR